MSQVERETDSDVNARTAALVKVLTELGPEIPEIARRLGQFKESVRYRYKEKILSKGYAVQGAVDHERLGLKRMMLIADFSETYRSFAQAILTAMSEVCYVVGFAKTLLGGEYVVNLSIPVELFEEVRRFFLALGEKGMFSKLEILDFDWYRNVPMKPEFYDFDTGRWSFEWQNPGSQVYEGAAYAPSKKSKFDYVDLLIIKELQMDANKSLKEMSEKLNVNYKKLAWHHSAHVCAQKLLHGYTVNWIGTRYDYTLEKVLHRKHRYFVLDLLVRRVNEYESMMLRQRMNALPFLWSEAGGQNYYAGIALPVDNVVEGLQYIGSATSSVRDRLSIYPGDQTEAASFTILYQLYDQPSKTWTFNREDLIQRFDKLMVEIRTGPTRPV
ncbi:MAG TPA: hypothetical protein VEC08_01645 [Nitrososphaerales archaeon]|nr:hypothetical protein [Nitrososphaerales archaeon]